MHKFLAEKCIFFKRFARTLAYVKKNYYLCEILKSNQQINRNNDPKT